MASQKKRVRVTLVCEVCQRRNYKTSKAVTDGDRLSLKKFCPGCRKHTLHKESR